MDDTASTGLLSTKADMQTATDAGDVIELRKQETRRRVTYIITFALCGGSLYLIGWGSEQTQSLAYGGLLSLGSSIAAFYFGGKQTGQ